MAVEDSVAILICDLAAVIFGLCFYYGIAHVEGSLHVVLTGLSAIMLVFTPYLVYVFVQVDISDAAVYILLCGLLRAVYIATLCRGIQLGEVTTVLSSFSGSSILGLLVCEAIVSEGRINFGPLDAVAVTLSVVGALTVAARQLLDTSGPVPADLVGVGFSQIDALDEEVQFDANPFETRAPKLSRSAVGKARAGVAAFIQGRHSSVRFGVAGGLAFGIAMCLERQGSQLMENKWFGFLASTGVVAIALLWPITSRLTDATEKGTADHKAAHLLALGGTGVLAHFWLASAGALSESTAGLSRSVTLYTSAVIAVSVILTKFGIGDSVDTFSFAAAGLTLIGGCFTVVGTSSA